MITIIVYLLYRAWVSFVKILVSQLDYAHVDSCAAARIHSWKRIKCYHLRFGIRNTSSTVDTFFAHFIMLISYESNSFNYIFPCSSLRFCEPLYGGPIWLCDSLTEVSCIN